MKHLIPILMILLIIGLYAPVSTFGYQGHFETMDVDSDEYVTWDEFNEFFSHATYEVFHEIDRDDDHLIQYDEWALFKETNDYTNREGAGRHYIDSYGSPIILLKGYWYRTIHGNKYRIVHGYRYRDRDGHYYRFSYGYWFRLGHGYSTIERRYSYPKRRGVSKKIHSSDHKRRTHHHPIVTPHKNVVVTPHKRVVVRPIKNPLVQPHKRIIVTPRFRNNRHKDIIHKKEDQMIREGKGGEALSSRKRVGLKQGGSKYKHRIRKGHRVSNHRRSGRIRSGGSISVR